MTNRAIFLDRDGTLNDEVGFITDPDQFHLFDFAAEAVRLINERGWRAIVVTNQSGIARGLYDEALLARIHDQMMSSLETSGARIDAIYFCPHHPEAGEPPYRAICDCRKPSLGMIERAAREFDLRLRDCFVIGDRYSDVALAHAANARGVLLLSGHGQIEYENDRDDWPRQPDHIAKDLLDAVRWILGTVPRA
ncbi:MAG: D-glycero-alpha-D-manno-heptose-1,7-bisphosphate 7-phosphatase [Blastocatellia bacterium]